MGAIVSVIVSENTLLFAALGSVLGALPDIDIHFEKAGLAKHRGVWSHSLLSSILLAVTFVGAWHVFPDHIPFWAWAVAFSATWIHTAADSLTVSGTYMFYPLSKKRFYGPARYNSILANVLFIIVCVSITALLVFPEYFTPIIP